MNKQFLDARRLLCPMPVIRVQDKIKTMIPGDQLEVVCTDPGVMQDIPTWCRINGHQILSASSDVGEFTINIIVGD
ncbi:MAG: sulfurtransferase TusA family protein [Methylococcales bacterium]